ncbi:double-strand break repair helicase AddA [Ponticoccus sp. SC2-23]|uniref:double-strand break repair helicase AddA n=1 Tax=Alexandriicola marinus TaxID=2081710 RepID=UPI000FD8CC1F|nr:double-strand break repair helicase AddA [Alexandriicola marinus]MBM1220742.1 double-strand break repair helicase AddA [Ponticoccus sp. SC6-9]MBM1226001.1 double-strand break repair helicase AddA [Ponticoccus sp. SC6-15]MBM1231298.1 double-strand break repair helicase AddA [Ponticoccus sp. SC6-38]MBM1235841.1 double-strand break repair helicase AddA [Ponticoccus sp. SC6-45]MBM1240321.1 double-strand break repair helicase AddA [Ponticoccus sp. SC6-49]MBM1244856.1 double-strand break repair 
MTVRNDATLAQVRAADPRNSTWLSANAGSGKTRVLTDRVARLLFNGVEPQNILCLTYTKAAASEMQNRLFATLGQWAMMADAKLSARLSDLGVEGSLGNVDLSRARTLFARAIETPGGLRIQTIHSFCAGLLRRFPLEAGVSPQFTEMEEAAARILAGEVLEDVSLARPDLVDRVARHITAGSFDDFLKAVIANRSAFLDPDAPKTLREAFGLTPLSHPDDAIGLAFTGGERAISEQLSDVFADQSATYKKFAAQIASVDFENPGQKDLETLFDLFLFKSGDRAGRSKSGQYPQSNHCRAIEAMEPIKDDVFDWMDRTEAALDHLKTCDAIARTETLYAFAGEFTRRYEAAKLARGQLDFEDQIAKARALLLDPRVAQWVLFRLDGGIDHILVDEAQDTSPAQWDVIRSLASEFAAGIGARADRERTIFVVGDKKQSIYSFQGADPEGFDRMADHFEDALRQVEKPFEREELLYSFRSSTAVLEVVDFTFQGEAGVGLGKDAPRHLAFHEAMPGRVDLWPALPKIEKEKDTGDWFAPVDSTSDEHHAKKLARTIAAEISRMISDGETIPDPENSGHRRPVTEGDILILLRGRGQKAVVSLHAEIIRACKKAGLSVAGSDRLRVGAELAVRDIEALLRFLALPEDDLSLATALRSPLFGWSEQDLFSLAHPRGGKRLWPALRDAADAHAETMKILRDLRKEADFLRPYDLINRLLTRHDGRRRLLSRLGQEAEDGIDALLGQALGYERSEVPGLTGFLEWLAGDNLEIKRQLDSTGNHLRVMTVHGAKGLEAPVVILPETAKRSPKDGAVIYSAGDHVIWKTPSDAAPPLQVQLKAERDEADRQEDRRLLYVAMTRAKTWLIVCAAGETGEETDSWHSMVSAGLDAARAEDIDTPTGPGKRHHSGDWEGLPLSPSKDTASTIVPALDPLPPAPPVRRSGGTLSPSDLGGAKVLPGETDEAEKEIALARGRLLHRLLEYLPDTDPEDRADLANRLVSEDPDATGLDTQGLIADADRILRTEALAPLFAAGTMSEVDLTAWIPALGARLHGTVDRLIVEGDTVTAIDYKSNRLVPERPEDVPEGLLRQMGAYMALMQEIWPDKERRVALLWTSTASLMPLPAHQVTEALGRVTVP